jgi:hypothetical protein
MFIICFVFTKGRVAVVVTVPVFALAYTVKLTWAV